MLNKKKENIIIKIRKEYNSEQKININHYHLKKKKRQEYNKEWFKRQPIERQQELKEKARQYLKNRCHDLMIVVS